MPEALRVEASLMQSIDLSRRHWARAWGLRRQNWRVCGRQKDGYR